MKKQQPQIVGIVQKGVKSRSNEADLLGVVRMFVSTALDISRENQGGEAIAEVILLLRKGDPAFQIRHRNEEKLKMDWAKLGERYCKPQSLLIDDWDEVKQQQLEKVLYVCKELFLPEMFRDLQSRDSVISTEITLKFKGGKFTWATKKEEYFFTS
ncbi:MAG: hypothetical protein WBB28_20795 [Crinalium sp.]